MAHLFTPVPTRTSRHDGWTPDRQHAFIDALARFGSVAHAARSVGMSARGAWRLRDRAGGEEFREAWDAAAEQGRQSARDHAVERATEGVEHPIVRRGRILGTVRRYDDRLLLAALRSHAAPPLFERRRAALATPERQAYEEAGFAALLVREADAIARRRAEQSGTPERSTYDPADWRNYR